ncbi:low molecular weight phosphotyrosine protein phosphatase [Acinetobacter soli]|uniref:low molecular weight protein-tyrosine-phosphatase n=1 Tax=Acinetobacter soli TaxID=487316 RepID=UPI0004691DFA|nr:low molecular weight protein-tyrosine-phosphatase [Acinetobacter soli]MEB4800920.1 low molecular weight protein-tyrosine-phosphatase [Acinetobacter soli]
MQIKHILVVCIGNICRSPMAEYLLKAEYPELHIESAGIAAMVGHGADDKAIQCMQSLNLDMSMHVAKKLDGSYVKKADLILVMSSNQQKHIETTWSFAKGKTFRLGHWQNKNVPDPYQHDQAFFDSTFQLIKLCIADWKKYI